MRQALVQLAPGRLQRRLPVGDRAAVRALDGLQVAQPSERHRDRLNRFASGAELYLNPNLRLVPGFGPKPGQRDPRNTTWFDDNGNWYGIVQRNARRALHRARDRHGLYLRTWYGKKASRSNAPKGSIQLHSANAALFTWMAALGR